MNLLLECLSTPEEFQAFDGLIYQYVAHEGEPVSTVTVQQYIEATYSVDSQGSGTHRILEPSIQAGFVSRLPFISAQKNLYIPKQKGINAFRFELLNKSEYIREYLGLLSVKSVGFEFFDERLELADKAQALLLGSGASTPGPQL